MIPPVNNNNNIPIAEKPEQVLGPEAMAPTVAPIGSEQVKKFIEILQKYKTGKVVTEQRIIAAENWWKLRNTVEEQKETNIAQDKGFASRSGWAHNVISSKHADAMASYPEAIVLPREAGDRVEGRMLSAIIPCVLEQNRFEATYSDASWKKMKGGTGVYKVVWDANKLNSLGDVSVESANILNLYWEPGITDIQKSRYFFHTELWDKDVLQEMYPEQLEGGLKGETFVSTKFLYDDTVSTENKITVIDVYYHKYVEGKNTLQYCKFVNDIVLFATENETEPTYDEAGKVKQPMSVTGLYDHGKYPYVFDALFPIEGSPCGYGYVDICKNPQTEIDLLKTSFVKNALVGSIPRYFTSTDSSLNEEEFLDTSNPLIHVTNVREDSLRKVDHIPLDGAYMNVMMQSIQELRETSGNTETSAGIATSVTTASGIAALQEASGKGSRDSTMGTYRAYAEIVTLVIELIRQFYDMPRKFRILGENGAEEYITYNNARLKPQAQGVAFGENMGYRLPVFDLKIVPQRRTSYSKQAQNELAVQFFQLGFFNAQMVDQALMAIGMMEFDGKDEIMQKISKNGTIYQKLVQYMQMCFQMAQKVAPHMVNQIAQDFAMVTGGKQMMGATPQLFEGTSEEPAHMEKARARSVNAAQPS